MTHTEAANEIRILADFIEAHPELPAPTTVIAWKSYSPKLDAAVISKAAGQLPVEIREYCGTDWNAHITVTKMCELHVSVDTKTLIPVGQVVTAASYKLPDPMQEVA